MSRIPEVVDAVVTCMSRNEMTPKVFCKGCAVLWKLTHQPEAVQVSLILVAKMVNYGGSMNLSSCAFIEVLF